MRTHSRRAKLSMLYLGIFHIAVAVVGFPVLFVVNVEPQDRAVFTLVFVIVLGIFGVAYFGVWTLKPWGRGALRLVRWTHGHGLRGARVLRG